MNLTPASALRCYIGTSTNSKSLTGCPSSILNRCLKATISGNTVYSCTSSSVLSASGYRDNTCSTISGVQYCVCSTDGCNSDSSSSSGSSGSSSSSGSSGSSSSSGSSGMFYHDNASKSKVYFS